MGVLWPVILIVIGALLLLRHTMHTIRMDNGSASDRKVTRTCAGTSDTPQGLQPHGFSVHPRRHPRESPKALSAP